MPDLQQQAPIAVPVGPARLRLPAAEVTIYPRNFIQSVVCEMRYPALLEVDPKQVKSVGHALRKRLPNYQAFRELNLGPTGETTDPATAHQYQSRDGKTTFVLRPSVLTLETRRYTAFEAFQEDVRLVVDACRDAIDTDFFTRVGLRYINGIPLADNTLEGWIRPELVQTLAQGVYGQVEQCIQDVRGFAAQRGRYTFRHGLPPHPEGAQATYLVDFDFWEEGVDLTDLTSLLDGFREEAYRFFFWAVGPKTMQVMSNSGR